MRRRRTNSSIFMEFTTLGKTDLKVSKICLGTMTWGEQNTEAEGHEQLDYALDRGVNFIDTAETYPVPSRRETYGSSERIIGTWIARRKNRDRVVLVSKIAGPSSLTWIRDPLRFDEASIREALEGSLQRLQTEYLDLYQLHWPERHTNYFGRRGYQHDPDDSWEDNFLEILRTMQDLIGEGKIRHFGISNETPWGLMHFLHLSEMHDLPRCTSIQNPYNLLNRTFEIGLAEIVIREQCGLLAYSPLAFGLLSGKYHTGKALPKARLNQFKEMSRYSGHETYRATIRYLDIAEEYGLNPPQMALAYVHSRPFLTSTVIGATTMEQLKENIDSINFQLPEEAVGEIEKIHNLIPNPAP
jgi:aryl-alcohol dehydrogenase-like predicted oxidoreductase